MKYFKEESIVFFDDKFIKANELTVDSYSQTLHYGNGVFEGIRSYDTTYGTKIFKAFEHYKRLKYGAEVMNIPFHYTEEELTAITYDLLAKNGLKDAYIRPIIITGANMGLAASEESHLIIQCWEWGKLMGDNLLKIKTSSYQRPNPNSCYVDAKITGHYVNSILARNEAKREGYDEALLLDSNGNVAECSGANVFIERNGKLYTPPKGHIMAGITRSTILDICKDEGIPVEEKHVTLEELKQSDACFFTGTAAEVVGLKSLDSYEFPLKWEDSLGFKLMKIYKDEVLGLRQKRKAS